MMDRKYINLQNQVKTAKFQEFLTDILRSSTELNSFIEEFSELLDGM